MAQNLSIATTRLQFKFEAYDYDLDKNVTVTVAIPRVKREADTDKILELGQAIKEACGFDYDPLSVYFIRTEDVL